MRRAVWHTFGLCHQAVLAVKRGDVASGLRLLDANTALRFLTFLSETAEALGRVGQIADGLVTIEDGIARSERTEECWLIAEFLRVKGELVLLQGVQDAAATGEDHFRQALR